MLIVLYFVPYFYFQLIEVLYLIYLNSSIHNLSRARAWPPLKWILGRVELVKSALDYSNLLVSEHDYCK